jgi:hypothetical protein
VDRHEWCVVWDVIAVTPAELAAAEEFTPAFGRAQPSLAVISRVDIYGRSTNKQGECLGA